MENLEIGDKVWVSTRREYIKYQEYVNEFLFIFYSSNEMLSLIYNLKELMHSSLVVISLLYV